MTVGIIFGRQRTGAEIAGFELDATLNERHERSAQITEDPIESGSLMSDHVIRDQRRVTIEGLVTDQPVIPFDSERSADGRDFPTKYDAFEQLDELWKNAEPFDIVTAYGEYENMVIERLEMPRQQESDALQFTIEAKQIRFVEPETAEIDEDRFDEEDVDSLQAESNFSDQVTEEPGDQTQKTLLQAGLGVLRGDD